MGALVLATTPLAAMQACGNTVIQQEVIVAADGTTQEPDTASADVVTDSLGTLDGLDFLDSACQVVVEILDAGTDVDQPCRYTLPCGLASDNAYTIQGCGFYLIGVEDGGDAALGCSIPEAYGCSDDVFTPPANGSVTFECIDCLGGGGRRPHGLHAAAPCDEHGEEADYFARMAHAEAASVHAFARMHEELASLGAPRDLLSATARAVRDEERHARVMGRRARSLGASPVKPRVRRQPRRALESIARENAVEGCIRETFGALVMHYQAANAADPALRRTFARIAADETRHAALSWELASWAEAQLSPRAQTRIAASRRRALRDLERTAQTRAPRAIDKAIGQPSPAKALALLAGLRAELGV